MRSTSACGGSHLVAQPVSGGCIRSSGQVLNEERNAALAGTGHGFSEMHALSVYGVKVWALNIEKKIRRETLQDLASHIYCAIPQDSLSDAPTSCAMGSRCLNMTSLGGIPLPLACALEVRYPRKRWVSLENVKFESFLRV